MKRLLAFALAILGTMLGLGLMILFLRWDGLLKLREHDWRRPLAEAIAEVEELTGREATT